MSRSESYIVGAGSTPCVRSPEIGPKQLVQEAVDRTLLDASISTDEVEAVYVANALAGLITGQECVRGQVFLQGSPLLGRPIMNIENACASGSSALNLAAQAVHAGIYETVLVLGIEKMSHPDKARSFSALEGALDIEEAHGVGEERSRSIFMDIYASKARRHNDAYGSTPTDFARVVEKNRRHASLNSIAQYRDLLSVDDVLGARMIVEPLTLPMCAPIGDAAAALVVTSKERATRPGAVRILASVVASGRPGAEPAVTRAARQAYEQAGIGPTDIDMAEVHDATASAEIEEYEHLGFAPAGEGHRLVASGVTSLGGRLPVNTSGGLISRGHPVGATGVLQVVELVTQLRRHAGDRQVESPRHALAQNAGGFLGEDVAVAVITILSLQ